MTDVALEHGIPVFLSQLAHALAPGEAVGEASNGSVPGADEAIAKSAALHGYDLLRNGLTVEQVVHGYGDVCQVVTELAAETGAAISADDFHVFNRCLDDAIAGAVTAYGSQREQDLAFEGTERMGVFAHELRNLLNTAILSFDVIKKGVVGLGGSTSALHSRSLAGLSVLAERSLAEIRQEIGHLLFQRISVLAFIEEIKVAAAMDADGRGLELSVDCLDTDAMIEVDRQLLTSAVWNLLQNAFKFSRAGGKVALTTRTANDRVVIEVRDECGGLPGGKTDELLRPFAQESSDRSGLGLGLSIALSAVRTNSGNLCVRDIPGEGCIFTIDLPWYPPGQGVDGR